jgi:hypothetical protein
VQDSVDTCRGIFDQNEVRDRDVKEGREGGPRSVDKAGLNVTDENVGAGFERFLEGLLLFKDLRRVGTEGAWFRQ